MSDAGVAEEERLRVRDRKAGKKERLKTKKATKEGGYGDRRRRQC